MTLITFIVAFVLALLHYLSAGALFYGYSIYKLAFWAVLASCSLSLWINRAPLEQYLNCMLVAVNMVLGWMAWETKDPVFWHAVLHVTIAAIIIVGYAQSRASLLVGGLFLMNVVFAVLQYSGALPDRPRVFTGFYYPDLIAYSGHASMMIIAGASGDSGKFTREFLLARFRLGHNHLSLVRARLLSMAQGIARN